MAKEWNPVAGLQEIKMEKLRTSDVVVVFDEDEGSYSRAVVRDKNYFKNLPLKFYMIDRPLPDEPNAMGVIVQAISVQKVRTFVRVVGGDTPYSDSESFEPWVELVDAWEIDGVVYAHTYSWAEIIDFAEEGYKLLREGI